MLGKFNLKFTFTVEMLDQIYIASTAKMVYANYCFNIQINDHINSVQYNHKWMLNDYQKFIVKVLDGC